MHDYAKNNQRREDFLIQKTTNRTQKDMELKNRSRTSSPHILTLNFQPVLAIRAAHISAHPTMMLLAANISAYR